MSSGVQVYRKLAGASTSGAILLAGLVAGSHWYRATHCPAVAPPAAALASNAPSAHRSPPFVSRPLAISHPAKLTPSFKPSAQGLRSAAASPPTISPESRVNAMKTYAALPMMFEANNGQTDPRVRFLAHAPGYTLFLTDKEALLSLPEPTPAQTGKPASIHPVPLEKTPHVPNLARVVRLKFVGGSTSASLTGRNQLPAKSNYFIGNDPKQWHTNVPNYSAAEYHSIYPGVDAVFHGDNRRLEFDFDIAPGADPQAIALEVEGVRRMRLNRAGDVVLRIGATRNVVMDKPHMYQQSSAGRHEIAGHYVLSARNRITFALGPYNHAQPLVIDPTVEYATYLGGSSYDYAKGIAVDSSSNAYVTGFTSSTNFPTVGPYQSTCVGCSGQYTGNAFVAKLNPAGSALVYSTYISGVAAYAIAVDSSGNTYLTGTAAQSGFPTMNPYQATSHGALYNAFVTKLNASGSALIYSTYLGGDYADEGFGIAVDSSGSAYVTGLTNSTGFPTVNPIQATCNSCAGSASLYDGDAFVTKFSPDGSSLVYSTYLGGSQQDWGQSIAVDSSGNAYITGITQSTDFPTMNPFQAANESTLLATTGSNAFVTKLNPEGSALTYSTYLGGSDEDLGIGIAVDSSGSAYVTGFAQSRNFPTMNPFQATMQGANNAFVTKFNAAGSALVYSSYLGGNSATQGNSIALDTFGNAYVAGSTTSNNFPLVDATQTSCLGCSSYSSAFVAQVNATGSVLLFSTYLGGGNETAGYGIGVDGSGNAYVAGLTESTNFPTVAPFQAANESTYGTAFVAKFAFSPTTTLTISPTTIPSGAAGALYSQTLTATGGTGTVTFAVTAGSLPSGITLTSAGVLSGTPTQTGTFPFTVTATDADNNTGTQAYSLQIVCQAITVDPTTLAAGISGTAYPAVTFTESGGIGTTTLSETGTLPTGITFVAPVLSGTTTQTGSFPFQVTATDSNSCSGNVSDTLTINAATQTPAVVTDNETITVTDTETFPDVADSEKVTVTDTDIVRAFNAIAITPAPASFDASSGTGYATHVYEPVQFTATGGIGTLTLSESGALPAGITFNSGTFSGTPATSAVGAYTFSVTATDADGDTLTLQGYTLTIQPASAFPAVVTDNEAITVTDTEIFPDVADSEKITVTDTETVKAYYTDNPSFAISANPDSLTIIQGQTGTTTITLTPAGGYTGTVKLSCSNLPANAICAFTQNGVTNNTLTLNGNNLPVSAVLAFETNVGGNQVRMEATPAPLNPILPAMVFWWSGSLAGLTAFRRKKKTRANRQRWFDLRLLLLLVVIVGVGLAGCGDGGLGMFVTPTGTSTVTVTAVPSSGTTQTLSIDVTITQ